MSLYVLLKIWLCKCLFLTLMRLYCMSRMSNQLFQKRSERYDIWERWMKLFHCCIHITKRERERGTHTSYEYAHQRATRAAAHNKRYRRSERERERERITLSERVYDDDNDAKFIRVRSSMRFDDLFVGEAEGNNNNKIDENESY